MISLLKHVNKATGKGQLQGDMNWPLAGLPHHVQPKSEAVIHTLYYSSSQKKPKNFTNPHRLAINRLEIVLFRSGTVAVCGAKPPRAKRHLGARRLLVNVDNGKEILLRR